MNKLIVSDETSYIGEHDKPAGSRKYLPTPYYLLHLSISAICLFLRLYRTCVQLSDSNATSLFIIYEPRLCDRHFIIFGIRFKRLENVNVRLAKLAQLWLNRPDLKACLPAVPAFPLY